MNGICAKLMCDSTILVEVFSYQRSKVLRYVHMFIRMEI